MMTMKTHIDEARMIVCFCVFIQGSIRSIVQEELDKHAEHLKDCH